jgi:hypothetical protein
MGCFVAPPTVSPQDYKNIISPWSCLRRSGYRGPLAFHSAQDAPEPVVGRWLHVVAFPFAAGTFYPITISPEMAALAMSGSSFIVAANALLLKRARIDGLR